MLKHLQGKHNQKTHGNKRGGRLAYTAGKDYATSTGMTKQEARQFGRDMATMQRNSQRMSDIDAISNNNKLTESRRKKLDEQYDALQKKNGEIRDAFVAKHGWDAWDRLQDTMPDIVERQYKPKKEKPKKEVKSPVTLVNPDKKLRGSLSESNEVSKQRVLSAITDVHQFDDRWGSVQFSNSLKSRNAQGGYVFENGYWEIQMNRSTQKSAPNDPNVSVTIVHEIGHYIDNQLGNGTLGFNSNGAARSPETMAWVDAVRNSRGYQELRDAKQAFKGKDRMASGRLNYLTDTNELFARSYAQYIAHRSGDPVLKKGIENGRQREEYTHEIERGFSENISKSFQSQWDDDDFEPIAQAMDALFESHGLRKKGK